MGICICKIVPAKHLKIIMVPALSSFLFLVQYIVVTLIYCELKAAVLSLRSTELFRIHDVFSFFSFEVLTRCVNSGISLIFHRREKLITSHISTQ